MSCFPVNSYDPDNLKIASSYKESRLCMIGTLWGVTKSKMKM